MNRMKKIITTIALMLLLVSLQSSVKAEIYMDGFVQGLFGGNLDEDNPAETDYSASETRMQLRLEDIGDRAEIFTRLDFTYDGALNDENYDWELREAYLKFRMGQNFDFKVGRQILTWGTGDYLFINDVFAKDYRSFFIGRDDQYLKAPQNALRMEWYNGLGNISLIVMPKFEPNRLPTGRRLSYFNPMVGSIVGTEDTDMYYFEGVEPENNFRNAEVAARLQRQIGYFNAALYFYKGFYKNPLAMKYFEEYSSNMAYYPKLNMYGGSIRGAFMGGIFWLEGAYLYSREDKDGDNPMVPNSSVKAFTGFERQVATNLTANIQWQVEYMTDYDNYEAETASYPEYLLVKDEMSHLLASRVTKTYNSETVKLSGFVFYSPTDEDLYLRLLTEYKYTDELTIEVGANIFDANYMNSQFGSTALNDNAYLKVTYGF